MSRSRRDARVNGRGASISDHPRDGFEGPAILG